MKKIFYILLLLSLVSCRDSDDLIGEYIVNLALDPREGDPPTPFLMNISWDKYTPRIGPIKYVEWNERYMLTEKNIEEEDRFYFIVARREKLSSFGCDSLGRLAQGSDTLIGPINKVQIDSLLKRYSIDKSDFKKNSY